MATFHYRLVSISGGPCILASDCNRIAQFLGSKKPWTGGGNQYTFRILHPSRLKRLRRSLTDSKLVIDRLQNRCEYLRMLKSQFPGATIARLESMGFSIRKFNQCPTFKFWFGYESSKARWYVLFCPWVCRLGHFVRCCCDPLTFPGAHLFFSLINSLILSRWSI
jgi:hypothetical protein